MTLCIVSLLDSSFDLIIGGRFLEPHCKVNNWDIHSWDTECHSGQLSIQSRKNFANSLVEKKKELKSHQEMLMVNNNIGG
jgi:hypothetical protein